MKARSIYFITNAVMATFVAVIVGCAGTNEPTSNPNSTFVELKDTTAEVIGQYYAQDAVAFRFGGYMNEQFAGTIYVPISMGKNAAVIIPPPSNEDHTTNKYIQSLVSFFKANGIIVFTYDYSGCGKSKGGYTGENFEDQVAIVNQAIAEIRKYKEVDENRVGLFLYGDFMQAPTLASAKNSRLNFIITQNVSLTSYDQSVKSSLAAAYGENSKEVEGIAAAFSYLENGSWERYVKSAGNLLGNRVGNFYLPATPEENYWNYLTGAIDIEGSTYFQSSNLKGLHFFDSNLDDMKVLGFEKELSANPGLQEHEVKHLAIDIGKMAIPPAMKDALSEWLSKSGLMTASKNVEKK